MLAGVRTLSVLVATTLLVIFAGSAAAQLSWPFGQKPNRPADRDCLREEPVAASGHLVLVKDGVTKPRPDQKAFQAMFGSLYPYDLWRAGVGGDVSVSFCISKTGRTFNHKITKSSGYPDLDYVTLLGLPHICWEPARDKKGRPVEICRSPYEMVIYWRPPPHPPKTPPHLLQAPSPRSKATSRSPSK